MIALLRGINVVGARQVPMEALRDVFASLRCTRVQTWINSGNVVFEPPLADKALLLEWLETAFERRFGFAIPTALRSTQELERIVRANPFPDEAAAEPGKLLIGFLLHKPSAAQKEALRALTFAPEKMAVAAGELFVYYPEGQGRSKLKMGPIERALGGRGTARNWNTVQKLLAMSRALDSGVD